MAAEVSAELERVIVADEEPAAFFERAPPRLARRMSSTIAAACKGAAAASLLCSGTRVWYLREVSELGRKTSQGYACAGVYDRNQYFSPHSVYGNSGCVPVDCEVDGKLCAVSTERLLSATSRYGPT